VVELGDLCEFANGGTPARSVQEYWGGDVPWITSADIQDGAVALGRSFVTEDGLRNSAATRVPAGTILLVSRTGIGKVAEAPEEISFSQDITAIKPNRRKLDQRYAIRFLEANKNHFERHARGATIKGITREAIEKLKIPLPALDEQRRIAAILDKADALRRKRKRALELLDGLTQSIFLGMFGDLVESSAYPRGTVASWVADFDTGKNLAPDPDGSRLNGYRVLKVSAVTSGIFVPAEAKPLPAGYKPPASHMVKEGDLLFSRANTTELIGATAYVHDIPHSLVLPDKIWRFKWHSDNAPNPRFIHALFSAPSFRREISKRATGTSGSMKNISKEKVLAIELAMPSRDEQERFVIRQRRTQDTVRAATAQLAVLEDHFSSLQYRAFSGQL
jgi:type I restriction enzyme S subunit